MAQSAEFKARAKEADRKRKLAAWAERKLRCPRAFGFEKDGEYLSVEFNRENGERVIAEYRRIGWARPPADLARDLIRRLNTVPVAVSYPYPRGERPDNRGSR
jgi:hypothetical protein